MNPRPNSIISCFKHHISRPLGRSRKTARGDKYAVVWPECFFDTTGNSETYAYYIKYVDLKCIHHTHYKINVLCVQYKCTNMRTWHILHTTMTSNRVSKDCINILYILNLAGPEHNVKYIYTHIIPSPSKWNE